MTVEGPSALSLIAAGFYLAVAWLCFNSWRRAVGMPKWHGRAWIVLCLLFVAMSLLRIIAFEDLVRTAMREVLTQGESYSERRELQAIMAVAFVGICAAVVLAGGRKMVAKIHSRPDRVVAVGILAGFAMIGLIGLRLISLHAVDQILFNQLRINWIADLGLSSLVGICAFYYAKLLTKKR